MNRTRLLVLVAVVVQAVVLDASDGERNFSQRILMRYCFGCHSGHVFEGGVDIEQLTADLSVASHFDAWNQVRKALDEGEMPPEDESQPTQSEKSALLRWLDSSLAKVAAENSGDPGMITVRRLTNAEYDNTVRDLTGVDLGLASSFQPDGGGGEGFSNVGDVLFVSPEQLGKYIGAARKIAKHASILPGQGIQFFKAPVGA